MGDAPAFAPRRMRVAEAAYYVGVSKSKFLADIAPTLRAVRIDGTVGWMREDLDAYLDRHALAGVASEAVRNEWHA